MVPSAEVKAVEPKPKKIRHAANKATGAQDTAGPPIIKIFDNGAKGRNQPVQCKLGDLREVQEKIKSRDNFAAAANAGLAGWCANRHPFFAEIEACKQLIILTAEAV